MKKAVIIILLLCGFIIINDKAALYYRQITPPISNPLPFGFTIDYYATKYHLRDKDRLYPIVCSDCPFPTAGNPLPNKEKVYVKKIISIHWISDQIIVNLQSKKGQKLIKIKDYVAESYVSDYDFVSPEALNKMKNSIYFDSPPIYIKFWPLIGSICLVLIFYLAHSQVLRN